MTDFSLIERIRQRVIEEGECWNWTGALQTCGSTPTMKYNGTVMAVRRAIMLERGVPMGKGRATYTCGNPMCVNPEHVGVRSIAAIQKRTIANLSAAQELIRGHNIAHALRKNKKHTRLSMEIAREIRAAEGTHLEIAKRYALDPADVSAIKRRRIWKEYVRNPLTGEMM